MFLLTDLLAVVLLTLLQILNGLLSFTLILLLLAIFFDRVDLFLSLRVLLLKLSLELLTSLLQTFNVHQGFLIWHQRLDRYKFLKFLILDVVLGVLVDIERVQVL